ncbi:MAG: FG-GAP-like repeat-containing protein, partial [Steroidobacteraceae bacterium]
MKSWGSSRRLAAGVFTLIVFGLSASASAAVGRTAGTYQVSSTGAATYTIPIWAPRGPNGLQPQIALTYNSQLGDGYLGLGWNVSGLSSIYRCTQTYAQDPAPAPVTLTIGDVFCMDGQRLRLTGGTYGDPDSTYQTEVANFANVTAYGSAGNGPSYFEVQGRDGRTYEYGDGGGSQVLAYGTTTAWIWYLDKVTDRAGNTMTITYCTDANSYCTQSGATASGTAVPVTISWTPTSQGAATYNYTMNFAYSTNVPQSSIYGYVGGTAYSNTSLLSTVTVEYAGTTVKKYAFSYGQSPTTGHDELTQVKECADSGETNCLEPTTFTYQGGSIGVSTNATTAFSTSAQMTELKSHNDFNGDGINDLAYCIGSPSVIYVAFGSSSGYSNPVDTGISCTNALFGDVTASGRDGILAPNGTDWWYYAWNGSGFAGEDTGLAYDSTASQYGLADLNGDGYPDLISSYATGGNYNIYVRLNISSPNISTCISSSACFSSNNNLWYGPVSTNQAGYSIITNTDGTNAYGTLKGFDFNGDGRQDIVLSVDISGATLNTYEMISGSSSFTPVFISSVSIRANGYKPTVFLDFNSDKCTDYLFNDIIYVSGCNGAVAQQVGLGSATVIGAMDWDGDGHTDILVQNGSTIGVYLSEGNGISSLQTTSIPCNVNDSYFAFDADGDGLDDLGVWDYSSIPYGVTYYLHSGAGQKPDLLSSVTDGYGNFAKPAYVSLAQGTGSTYTPGYSYQLSGYVGYAPYIDPLYVVKNVTFSDPSNQPAGTYTSTYSYSDAATNIQGRGFVGFATKTVADSRTGVYETLGYVQDFPDSGIVESDVATQNGNSQETVFSRTYSIANYTLGGERAFPVVTAFFDNEYEVGGSENGQLVSSSVTDYEYDQYDNITWTQKTVTDEDPVSPYLGESWTTTVTNTPDADVSTWCLGLLSEQQLSYTASDGSPSVTRTRELTPDTTNCRYTQIVTEPSSSSYALTETLAYDSFGNINSDTLTGNNLAVRHTSASWGTTGQFPMSVTDASGATTQLNYNFSYGLVSSETDPNNVKTSWQYEDGFGRLTQETRPDGTYTSYTYNSCGSSGGCLMGANTLAVAHYDYNTDGSIETDGTTYYDELERPIVANNMMLSGTQWDRNEVRYDSLGRIVKRAAPCVWSAVTTPCSYWTTMSYDILNRLTQVQRPISQSDSSLDTTTYGYQGHMRTITDANGHERTLIHDVNGWLRQTKDDLGYTVILGYDAAGAKTSVTDSLGNTLWKGTYAYGVAPFLVSETDADRGTWSYVVDPLGEPYHWSDAKGKNFYQSYDALSRPISRDEPDLTTHWIWGNNAADHNLGKLVNVCTGPGYPCTSTYYYSETETYDSLGRLYQRSIAIPAVGTSTYTWLYNATTGLLDTLTYPVSTSGKALQLKYAYQSGILESITDVLDSNVTIWKADSDNPAGQITQETLGNGLVTSRAYDAVTQWLASVQSGPGGGAAVQNQSFLYDEVGNVSQRQDNNLGLSENFYYDGDNRLSYSTLNGTQNLSLNYNQMGNITSRTDVAGGATWTYDPVHLHEVTEAGSSAYQYAYDANGNMTSRQGGSITWSSYNYPTLINDTATGESVSFSYDPNRQACVEETQS